MQKLLVDVRFKLLTIVPAVTGTAVGLLGKPGPSAAPIAILGLLATVGIAVYEIRNSQLHDAAIHRLRFLEQLLVLPSSAHRGLGGVTRDRSSRSLTVLGIGLWHDLALAVVYGTSVAGWAWLLLSALLVVEPFDWRSVVSVGSVAALTGFGVARVIVSKSGQFRPLNRVVLLPASPAVNEDGLDRIKDVLFAVKAVRSGRWGTLAKLRDLPAWRYRGESVKCRMREEVQVEAWLRHALELAMVGEMQVGFRKRLFIPRSLRGEAVTWNERRDVLMFWSPRGRRLYGLIVSRGPSRGVCLNRADLQRWAIREIFSESIYLLDETLQAVESCGRASVKRIREVIVRDGSAPWLDDEQVERRLRWLRALREVDLVGGTQWEISSQNYRCSCE